MRSKIVAGTLALLASALTLGACAESATEVESASDEDARLGIAKLQIKETATQVDITAENSAGELVGEVRLVEGTFMVPEIEKMLPARTLTIRVNGRHSPTHVSALSTTVTLPLLGDSFGAMDAFLHHPRVAAALARRHVNFEPLAPSSIVAPLDVLEAAPAVRSSTGQEAPYAWEVCSGNVTMSDSEGSSCRSATSYNSENCGYAGVEWTGANGVVFQFKNCDIDKTYQNRDTIVKRACTSANSSNICGITGSHGCSVCWSFGGHCNCSTGWYSSGACTYSCQDHY